MYELLILSRARSTSARAAAATPSEAFALTGETLPPSRPGFNGSGGGARSGSELSHLRFDKILISDMFV